MKNIQSKIKEYRTEHKLTQTQIANLLGMTYQEYQKIETGKTIIRTDKLQHICETLNISADWLLGFSEEKEKPSLRVPSENEWMEADEATKEAYKKAVSELLAKHNNSLRREREESKKNIG